MTEISENNTLTPSTTVSLMTVVLEQKMQKRLSYQNGVFVKEPVANLATYPAVVVELTLENLFIAVSNGECTIIAGYIEGSTTGESVEFISKSKFNSNFPDKDSPFVINAKWVSARIQDHLKAACLLLIDYDVSNETPEEYKKLSPAELIERLTVLMPEFQLAGYVSNYGSSAGIFDANGLEISPAAGFHLYFIVKDADDLPRFKQVLFDKCLLEGWFWYKTDKNGGSRIQTLFDKSAINTERLCFETSPVLLDGLVRKVPDPSLHEGEVHDTKLLLDLTDAEEAKVKAILGKSSNPLVASNIPMNAASVDNTTLQPDTPITLADGTSSTPQAFLDSGVYKEVCFSPIRDDMNASAFIARHDKLPSVVYVFDSGLSKTFFCNLGSVAGKKLFEGVDITIDNFELQMAGHGIVPRYDMIKKLINIDYPSSNFLPDNEASAKLALLHSLAKEDGFKISSDLIGKYLIPIADKNHVNPVEDWFRSKSWDGVNRLQDLCDTLVVPKGMEGFRDIALRRWLIGAVASALSITGNKNEIIFTLVGPQSCGKTTWVNSLVPKDTNWLIDGVSLNPNDKDSVKLVVSHFICELGELDATFRKSDIAALKAFMSKSTDEMRNPYAATFSQYPRRVAICASVNDSNFLVDETGNRRFSVVSVDSIKRHTIDMQQLWAQILTYYKAGEQWWLTDDEANMQSLVNLQHQMIDPIEEMLLNHFNFDDFVFDGPLLNPTGIFNLMGIIKPSKSDTTKMGRLLKAKNLIKKGRLYQMPKAKII